MTSQQILSHSLTYKSYLRSLGVKIDDHVNRLLNGLTEYLANMAQLLDGEDCQVCPPAGAPRHSELVLDDADPSD